MVFISPSVTHGDRHHPVPHSHTRFNTRSGTKPDHQPDTHPNQRRAQAWHGWVPMCLVLLCVVPSVAGVARLWALAGGAQVTAANARFVAAPLPVVLHILAVVPFGLLGAVQLSPVLRQHWPHWHRMAGRVLVVLGAVAALSGLWMAQFYPWPAGDGLLLYGLRLVVGTAMVAAIALAVWAVRQRRYAAHAAWMVRAYALGMGAGTQVLTHIPFFLLVGTPGETARAVLMGTGWLINVAVAEWAIRRMDTPHRMPHRTPRGTPAATSETSVLAATSATTPAPAPAPAAWQAAGPLPAGPVLKTLSISSTGVSP